MQKKLMKGLSKLYKIASRIGNKAIGIEEGVPKAVKMLALLGLLVGSALLTWLYLRDKTIAILQPHGTVGLEQRKLIYTALLLSLVVVVPVFTMALFIYSKYRETNQSAKYQPGWDHNRSIEAVWWTIPVILIGILSVITWKSSHDLDPFRPIASSKKPLTVEVVAMDWKWLFIYPEQGVASVNEAHIPVDTPIDFKVTSDAPMNSFWIPELGGQIYAMSGMTTHLNVMATSEGSFNGASANISGKGFAGMKFVVKANKQSDFETWSSGVRSRASSLDSAKYRELAKPSEDSSVTTYSLADYSLFDKVLMKYMNATSVNQSTELKDSYGGVQ